MLAGPLIAIFLFPVTYYVVERFAASRRRLARQDVLKGESGTVSGS